MATVCWRCDKSFTHNYLLCKGGDKPTSVIRKNVKDSKKSFRIENPGVGLAKGSMYQQRVSWKRDGTLLSVEFMTPFLNNLAQWLYEFDEQWDEEGGIQLHSNGYIQNLDTLVDLDYKLRRKLPEIKAITNTAIGCDLEEYNYLDVGIFNGLIQTVKCTRDRMVSKVTVTVANAKRGDKIINDIMDKTTQFLESMIALEKNLSSSRLEFRSCGRVRDELITKGGELDVIKDYVLSLSTLKIRSRIADFCKTKCSARFDALKTKISRREAEVIAALQEEARVENGVESQFMCPVCRVTNIGVVYRCGHGTCLKCSTSELLTSCPLCRGPISFKTRLYH